MTVPFRLGVVLGIACILKDFRTSEMEHGNEQSQRCVTYSVSFCDNFYSGINEDPSAPLVDNEENNVFNDTNEVSDQNSGREPSSNIGIPSTSRNAILSPAQSCPIEVPSCRRYKHHAVYGTSLSYSPGTDAANGMAKRIIYCVHGKPSGCCLTPEGDIIDKSGAIVPGERRDSHSASGEHCHRSSREEKVDQKARRKLIIASVLCVLFMIAEIIGGYMSSSLAIATDAAHLLTDFASFMISLFSLWVASRPATRRMSFGWYRAEVIGALTSVLMIWVITGILVYLAIQRIITEEYEIDAKIMLITSAVGVAVNLVMGLTLHQHGHSHGGGVSHNHSHGVEAGSGSHSHEQQNINVRAAFIHVVGDFIQSFGVFLAALVIYYKPTWMIIDPICTFLFSILVLITTFAIIKDTILVLMEGMPKGIDFSAVLETLLQIDGVVRVHNLRIWALSLDKTALAAHLAIRPGVNPQKILTEASRNIHLKFSFFEMTLQIEEFDAEMEDCTQCQCPEV